MRQLITGARGALALVPLLALLACTEDLTSPGVCPQTCPGGSVQIRDLVLTPTLNGDSAYSGYVLAGAGSGLLVSTANPGDEYLTAARFGRRPDSVSIADTLHPYVLDSVVIRLGVLSRDSFATGLALQLYRAPATLDTGVTFPDVASYLTPATFLDSIVIPDTLYTGNVQAVFKGADLAKLDIPPADSGVLSIAVGLTATAATGVRLGSTSAGTAIPTVLYYVSVPGVDSTKQPPAISRVPNFATFVEQNPTVAAPDQLLLGGTPSSRILLRFSVPDSVLTGVQILRAELVLTPAVPIEGVSGIGSTLIARGVLSDQGAKSPLLPLLTPNVAVTAGSTDSLSLEVLGIVQTWQTAVNPPPQAFFLSLQPEGSSFTRPLFASTRSLTGAPRLRITYVTPLNFEVP